MPPYCASQALGQERLVEIGRKTGTQLSEDSLDLYIECDEDQELLVTDAHLVCSSLHSSKIDVVKLDEIEHIDVAEARNKLVVRILVYCSIGIAIARRMLTLGCWPRRVPYVPPTADSQECERSNRCSLRRCRGHRGARASSPTIRELSHSCAPRQACRNAVSKMDGSTCSAARYCWCPCHPLCKLAHAVYETRNLRKPLRLGAL